MQIEKILERYLFFKILKWIKSFLKALIQSCLHVLKIEIFIYLYAVLTIRMKQNGLEQKHRILI